MTPIENPLFIVLARGRNHVQEKIRELDGFKVPYVIICGEHLDHPSVIYRAPKGKYDAINFIEEEENISKGAKIVAFNDVDTKIGRFEEMLHYFEDPSVAIVFAAELVREGPQRVFFTIFNPIRRFLPLAASGELMMVRQEVLRKILPLKPCKAEDTYIMFKALELGYKVVFCEKCYAETVRTKSAKAEELYKRKTVSGIYQALSYTKPPWSVKFFYTFLPLASLFLPILGRTGYYWMKGILLGFLDYSRGDRSGSWKNTYMD